MERPQEEMQYVGFFGIYKESFKIIFSWKKLFAQLTLTLILPLAFIFLAHMQISNLLFSRIHDSVLGVYGGSNMYRHRNNSSSELAYYWLFRLVYFTFVFIFSLLSTAAVVYTIACVYTGRDVTYKKVMKVIPRVWKRLVVTFICIFLALFLYNIIAGVIFVIWDVSNQGSVIGIVFFFVILILYAFGLLYLSVVYQLASVVTVLEKSYGIKAMKKGNQLIKGKRWVGLGVFFILDCILAGIIVLYVVFVVYGNEVARFGMFERVVLGLVCLLLTVFLFLYGLVAQTVLYLVCKSHHRETIDKLGLSTHLGSYLGEYQRAPPVTDEIQLGQPQPQPQAPAPARAQV